MSKPDALHTKIFLDSGDPADTVAVKAALGWPDGQTTNPSLVAKHPEFQACAKRSGGCQPEDLWNVYRTLVSEISRHVTDSVSIEVYADNTTSTDAMVAEGRELHTWIPNAHIKLPVNTAGLAAAEILVADGIRVNVTLCFTQSQVAAVYAATRGAALGAVYASPFIGRLDDQGQDGMSFIKNVVAMLDDSDGHVQLLAASVRTVDHLMASIAAEASIVTAPTDVLLEWAAAGRPLPDTSFVYEVGEKTPIQFEAIDMTADWRTFDITHPLTTAGIERFAADWNAALS